MRLWGIVVSGVLAGTLLAQMPSCTRSVASPNHCSNGIKDGDESGLDCGGSCPGCPVGERCVSDSDCITDNCGNGWCREASTCSNGKKDNGESDVDCGGDNCEPCFGGMTCNEDEDCASHYCAGGVCTYPAC